MVAHSIRVAALCISVAAGVTLDELLAAEPEEQEAVGGALEDRRAFALENANNTAHLARHQLRSELCTSSSRTRVYEYYLVEQLENAKAERERGRTLATRDALEARRERAFRERMQRAHALREALRAQVAEHQRARLALPLEAARVVLLQLLRARLREWERERTRRRRRRLRAARRRARAGNRSGGRWRTRGHARQVWRECAGQREVLNHVAHAAAPFLRKREKTICDWLKFILCPCVTNLQLTVH